MNGSFGWGMWVQRDLYQNSFESDCGVNNQCLYFFLIIKLNGTIPNQMYCAIFKFMNDTKIDRENTAGSERRFTITPFTKSG
jgi:hypothetical protein